MLRYTSNEIESLIESDIALNDITTQLQDLEFDACLQIYSREDTVASSLDGVEQICDIFRAKYFSKFQNGDKIAKNSVILTVHAPYTIIHQIYKIAQILLERACAIASYTKTLTTLAKNENQACEILATRKVIPFAKKLCLKAVLDGGAKVHRLGLSDSVLFFDTHIAFSGGVAKFCSAIDKMKNLLCEKKLVVEVSNLSDAKTVLKTDIDVIMCDKMSVKNVCEVVALKSQISPNKVVLAGGGIDITNASLYAKTGANALVTSSMYSAKVANFGVKILKS